MCPAAMVTTQRLTTTDLFFLVLEVNCISNLSLNHTLQLTTPRTSVRESLCMHGSTVKSDWLFYRIVVNLVAWLNVASEDNLIFIKQPEK